MSEDEDVGEDVGEWKCFRETSKAILVKNGNGDKKWIPKSVITDDSEVYKDGTEGALIVESWFAEKEFG